MSRRYRNQSTTDPSKLPLSQRPHVARLYRNVFLSDIAYEGLTAKAASHNYILPDPTRAKGLYVFIADLFRLTPADDFLDTRPEDYLLPIDSIPPSERPMYRALQRNPFAAQLYPLWSPPMMLADPEPDRQRGRLIKMTDDTYDAILVVALTHEIANSNRRDHTFKTIESSIQAGAAAAAIPSSVLTSMMSAVLEAIGRGWLTPKYWPDNPNPPKQRRPKNWRPEDALPFYA